MIKFGTGGWRAIIGDEFIKDNVYLLTQGLADIIKEEGYESQGVVVDMTEGSYRTKLPDG